MKFPNWPGESMWLPMKHVVRGDQLQVDDDAVIIAGGLTGKIGFVRAVDGANEAIQIRTGSREAWASFDAQTARILEEVRCNRDG
jgi:hypothetical protein